MSLKDLAMALITIVIWGLNFLVIKFGLDGLPPMLLGGLRFCLVAFPAVFFIKRPEIPWRWLLAYGATISLGQFAFLFEAMHVGMPPGMASLVLQTQAFFTLVFGAVFLGESFRLPSVLGLLVAAGGLVLIGSNGNGAFSLLSLVLTLLAAAMWALGNIVTRKLGKTDLVALVIWGALIPPIPFFVMSWWIEGPQRMYESLSHIGLSTILSLAYLAFAATMVGYSMWSKLLSKHPAGRVAPFSLLVPVVGMSSAAMVLDERFTQVQWAGCMFVMMGLTINVFGGPLLKWISARINTA